MVTTRATSLATMAGGLSPLGPIRSPRESCRRSTTESNRRARYPARSAVKTTGKKRPADDTTTFSSKSKEMPETKRRAGKMTGKKRPAGDIKTFSSKSKEMPETKRRAGKMTGKKRPAGDIETFSSKSKEMPETKRRAGKMLETKRRARFSGLLTKRDICGSVLSKRSGSIESHERESYLSDLKRYSDHQGTLSEEVAVSCRSVVSVALTNGHEVLFSYSGIAIESQGNVARFLTSSCLVRALEESTNKGHNNVKIEIRREGIVVIGILAEYDLGLEFAIVTALSFPDMRGILVDHDLKVVPGNKAIAVGRDASGKLMTAVGAIRFWSTPSEGRRYYVNFYRTCGFSKDWHGGALFDFDGNLIGMNLIPVTAPWDRKPYFMLKCIVRRRFEYLRADPQRYMPWDHTLGYPKPSPDMISRGMILARTFEEPFGDEYPKGVWNEFSSKSVSASIYRNVVALASFNGEKRFFACSGFFIEFGDECPTILTSANLVRCPSGEYNIVEGLRIEVLLPNGRHTEGSLQHFSFHHNIAIVTIKNSRFAVRPWRLEREVNHRFDPSLELVAVGRCYKSGILMAASGRQAGRRSCFRWAFTDAKGGYTHHDLSQCTFVISKAGIGGPIVDVDRNVVGMSFYWPTGAALLDYTWLCAVVHYFKTGSIVYRTPSGMKFDIEDDKEGAEEKHSWGVLEARWLDPRDLEEEEDRVRVDPADLYKCGVIASGRRYIRGPHGAPLVLC